MNALLSEKTDIEKDTQSAESVRRPAALPLALLAFLTGLLPCLMHNLAFCESRIMLATDGKHFLHTVSLIVEYLKQLGNHAAAQKFLAESQLPQHVLFDGPIMSLIYSPIFFLLNKIPTPRDWPVMAAGQSCFHACSTTLLTVLVLRLTRSPLFAVMTAIIYGMYPPAILQSGHFMSELPVTTLLITMVLLLSSRKTTNIDGTEKAKNVLPFMGVGLCAGLLILSKPALIPCVLLTCALGIFNYRELPSIATREAEAKSSEEFPETAKKKRESASSKLLRFTSARKFCLLGTLIGMMTVVSLWSTFCFSATGSIFPTAQRQPLYNVVSGWNVEAEGWAHTPHPPLTEMFTEEDGPLASAAGIWISHPQESFRLAVSKISRLAACPWNDFKGRALGLDENAQILFHRLILACSIFGLSIYFFCSRRYLDAEQRNILLLSALLIVSHLSYIMVECQPRYTFPAVPFAVLWAVYGFWQVSCLSFRDPIRRLAIFSSVAAALGLSAFILHSENICRLFEPKAFNEKSHLLSMNDRVEKVINLAGAAIPANVGSVLLMVDGDKNLEKCAIELNGVPLSKHFVSTMHFDSSHYSIFDQLREFGPSMRIAVGDFRQWRAIEVDPKLLNWNGSNRVVLTMRSKESTIYGDRKKTRYALSPDYCNYGILAAAPVAAGAESRYTDPVLTAATEEESFLTTKTEPKNRLKDSLRLRLLVSVSKPPKVVSQESDLASDSVPKTVNEVALTRVSRESFDRMLWDNNSTDCLHINKVVLYAARTVGADIPLPKTENTTHVRISIKAELKALKNAGDVGLLCALKGKNGAIQILGKTPRALTATESWRKIQIDDVVPLAALGGRADSLELALYPCPWMEGQYGVSRRATDALFRNITIESSGSNLPAISNRRIIY